MRGSGMRTLRTFTSADGKRELRIVQLQNGLFSYREWALEAEDLTEFGLGIETFWASAADAGLYDSATAAELDARAQVNWLRDNTN